MSTGFDFSNNLRNNTLGQRNLALPKVSYESEEWGLLRCGTAPEERGMMRPFVSRCSWQDQAQELRRELQYYRGVL